MKLVIIDEDSCTRATVHENIESVRFDLHHAREDLVTDIMELIEKLKEVR